MDTAIIGHMEMVAVHIIIVKYYYITLSARIIINGIFHKQVDVVMQHQQQHLFRNHYNRIVTHHELFISVMKVIHVL